MQGIDAPMTPLRYNFGKCNYTGLLAASGGLPIFV